MPHHQSCKTVYRITKSDLLVLLNKSTSEILKKLNQSDFGFIHFLERCSYKESDEEQILEIVVKLLSQVCSLNRQKQKACLNRLLRMLKSCQDFLFKDIPSIINLSFSRKAKISLDTFMGNYMVILETLLSKDFFPCERIVNEIFPSMENYMNRLYEKKGNVAFVQKCFHDLEIKIEKYENPVFSDDDDKEIENFRNLPVVPQKNDFINYQIRNIPHNIIDHPYESVDHFLSVYYRLTREDMLRSLQECIKECVKSKSPYSFSPSKNHFFEKVFSVSDPEYTTEGICYDIKVTSTKEIDWTKKEILMPGNLVVLTPDEFNTVIIATIKTNSRASQNKSKECKIKIKLEDDVTFNELTHQEFKMIKPAAYFECYKHVLTAIKDFTEANFPLSDVLAYLDYDDLEPEYLDGKKYCLHEKCGGFSEHTDNDPCKVFDPLKEDEWPIIEDLEKLGLDEKQYVAFKTAITKKVAVVQGPPGTGKTHVGVKIVKTFLENDSPKPILICCLTNHALDHFLEGIMVHTKKIVRLGSQSKNSAIEPYKLENLVYALRQYHTQMILDESQQKYLKVVKDIASTVLNEKIISKYDAEFSKLRKLCQKINGNQSSISLCEDKFLTEIALCTIIDKMYVNQLCSTPGLIKKSICSGILEWLVCSRISDLYDKCCKYFSNFDKKPVNLPNFENVWKLTERERFEVFYCWRKKVLQERKNILMYDIEVYKKLIKLYKGKEVDDQKLEIVKGASIVGVTTTGASKFKSLIRFSKPRIIIIEEAAQVLESHVIASLVPSIQHLILIGDHEQLRPLPTNHELSEKYNLKISMFERLFNNKAPSATLVSQHRMKPCIAELLVPFPYSEYTSHDSVYEYEEIKGVQTSVFFFDHSKEEDNNSSGTSSSNEFEAKMIVSFAKYLNMQSYPLKNITVIATYAAQVALIYKNLLEENICITVTTVDNFQGEENDIILISFVRSNPSAIGFLKESNRVCVALSRAKKGMFCFGNFKLFSSKNEVWKNIVEKANKMNIIGDSLTLKCNRHGILCPVKCKEEIEEFINSGCSAPCDFLLLCQHRCALTCHLKDLDHCNYICRQPCGRIIDENKICPRLCYERCKKIKKREVALPCGHFSSSKDSVLCFKDVPKILICQHIITIPCYLASTNINKCGASIKIDLNCGHTKTILCHEQYEKNNMICTELQPKIGACGHTVYVPCSLYFDENELVAFCNKSCGVLLDCGHPCIRYCRICFDTNIHGLCTEKCEQKLPCGHKCSGDCNRPCPPCNQKCFLVCVHHTVCINDCLRPCVKCDEPCARGCIHDHCVKKCFETCDLKPCLKPCSEFLPCGHPCIGLCGDPCPNLCRFCHADYFSDGITKNSYYVELQCEDVIEVNKLTEHIKDCLLSFDWPCCPKCDKIITQSIRYKEELKQAKEQCIESYDTSEEVLIIHYLIDTMYGEDYNVPALFLSIHEKIQKILKKKNTQYDSLIVLKNCVMLLMKLVAISPKLMDLHDEQLQVTFDTLLIWISDHLTIASFQQLIELQSAVNLLDSKIESTIGCKRLNS